MEHSHFKPITATVANFALQPSATTIRTPAELAPISGTAYASDAQMTKSGVPARLIGATFANYSAPLKGQQNALESIEGYSRYFARGKMLPATCAILYGTPGTGKTHLACALLRSLTGSFGFRYSTVSQLARRVRSTYHRNATEHESDILSEYVEKSMLVLDEIGAGTGTDHERAMLHDVIAGRYDARKPTMLITNLSLDDTKAALGDRIVDRFRDDHGLIVPFNWPSYRGTV